MTAQNGINPELGSFTMSPNVIPTLETLVSRIPRGNLLSQTVENGLDFVLGEVQKLKTVVEKDDPLASALSRFIEISGQRVAVYQFMRKIQYALNQAVEAFKVASLNKRLMDSDLKQDAYAAETRSVFRGLSLPDKHRFLGQAVEEGQGSILAALVLNDVPSQLTGLSKTELENYKTAYLDQWSEYDSDYIDAMESVLDTFWSVVAPMALGEMPPEIAKHRPGLAKELAALNITT